MINDTHVNNSDVNTNNNSIRNSSVRKNLLDIGFLNTISKSRWLQPLLELFSLAIFSFLITAGLIGIPMGNSNAAIVIIWIFWFFLLIVALIPLAGRSWCAMCPLPAPGEWLSRGAIIRKSDKKFNLRIKWPKKLSNIWLQNIGFLIVAVFSPIILTRPWATSWLLIVLIIVSTATSLIFTYKGRMGRVFCKFICPLGGFIGLYSLMGGLEVRIKDAEVCRGHRVKDCIIGNKHGYGCPWYEKPQHMDRNIYCGLCTECIKTCPKNNVAVNLRPLGEDILKERKLNESFKSFIMIASGMAFLIVFFGWWGFWKDLANYIPGVYPQGPVSWQNIGIFASILWGTSLGLIPGLVFLTSWLSKIFTRAKSISVKNIFTDIGYVLIPLGLTAWIAFVTGMVMINGSYIVSTISDPFGWGWDLFGTANFKWTPYLPEIVPYLQTLIMMGGAIFSTVTGWKMSVRNFGREKAPAGMIPVCLLMTVLTGVFLFIFMGGV